MKKVMLIVLAAFVHQFAMGQHNPKNDPTYSINNYKHKNKATYAERYLEKDRAHYAMTSITTNENYKQPYGKTSTSRRAAIPSGTVSGKTNQSYKHPYGL